MAREKATITLDREKAAEAMRLIEGESTSQVVDVALDRLIRAEHLRRDVQAYTKQPLTDDELALVDLPVELDLDDAETDYDTLYG